MKKPEKQAKIIPLGDRVLIKLSNERDGEQKSKFGIIIPDTVSKEKSEQGEIVALGYGRRDDSGKIVPFTVKVGDRVMFSKYSFDELTINEIKYVVVKEENILAILK